MTNSYKPMGMININDTFVTGPRDKRRKKLNTKKLYTKPIPANKKTSSNIETIQKGNFKKNGSPKILGFNFKKLSQVKTVFDPNIERSLERESIYQSERNAQKGGVKVEGVSVHNPDGYADKKKHFHKNKPWKPFNRRPGVGGV